MTKANINNVKRVLNTIVDQVIHITESNAMFDKSAQPTA